MLCRLHQKIEEKRLRFVPGFMITSGDNARDSFPFADSLNRLSLTITNKVKILISFHFYVWLMSKQKCFCVKDSTIYMADDWNPLKCLTTLPWSRRSHLKTKVNKTIYHHQLRSEMMNTKERNTKKTRWAIIWFLLYKKPLLKDFLISVYSLKIRPQNAFWMTNMKFVFFVHGRNLYLHY